MKMIANSCNPFVVHVNRPVLQQGMGRHRSGDITGSWHFDELRQDEISFESAISLLG